MAEQKKKRGTQKARLTKYEKDIVELSLDPHSCNFGFLDEQLDSIFTKFNEIQHGIINAGEGDEPDPAELEELTDFETRVVKLKGQLQKIKTAQQQANQANQAGPSGSGGSHNGGNHLGDATKQSVKLPEIKLPSFSGNTYEWLSFRDLWLVNVHNKQNLDGCEKLQYLKGVVTGEAAELIDNLATTTDNYDVAWRLLEDRYNNPKRLRASFLDQLFSQPKMSQESATDLRKFADTTKRCQRSLQHLGREDPHQHQTLLNAVFLHLLVPKLDSKSRREWEFSTVTREGSTVDDFIKFLNDRSEVLNNLPDSPTFEPPAKQSRFNKNQPLPATSTRTPAVKPNYCPSCGSTEHVLARCANFLAMDVVNRRDFVKSKGLCFNCLKKDHLSKDCSSSNCRKCDQRHNTSLHLEPPSAPVVATTMSGHHTQVLLGTAFIYAEDFKGNLQRIRVLVDNCSQRNLMSKACLQKLGLPSAPSTNAVAGVNDTTVGVASGLVRVKLMSIVNPSCCFEVDASVLPRVTADLPQAPVIGTNWSHLEGIQLADPTFFKPASIDMLLGVVAYNHIVLKDRRDGPPGTPSAQASQFGWLISGEAPIQLPSTASVALCTLDAQVRQFWEMEEVDPKKYTSAEAQAAENVFAATTHRTTEGRYVVDLPFKSAAPDLADSRQRALQRLFSVERQLAKSEERRRQYHDFMKEYLDLGHMVPVQPTEGASYYLPHHGVIKEDSSTTKLRVVFDASAPTTNGRALNGELLVAAPNQDDIFDLLVRFRKHIVAFTADVEKMFRQIWVNQDHRRYQRILWRFDTRKPVQEYELMTVTYGTSCAPFLATRCLQQLAIDEGHHYPTAAAVLASDVYMDDVLSGTSSATSAITTASGLQQLLMAGGFQLRKWSSNSAALLATIPEELQEKKASLRFEDDPKAKTLGIRWKPKEDVFYFSVQEPGPVSTKRQLLSDVAKVFDPLGFLAPVTVSAKILLQSLWLKNLSWDQKLPTDVLQTWTHYRQELEKVAEINVPRCLVNLEPERVELHGFCDASESAFAAAVYLRSMGNEVTVRLVAAKTKVAPLKSISLPKLELCGANLLVQLIEHVKSALKTNFEDVKYWTDSTIVLAWLQCQPSTLKCFVANRVSNIQQVSSPSSWYHVPGTSNPADCASRGIPASALIKHSLWWSGPDFLSKSEFTPQLQNSPCLEEIPERRPAKVFVTIDPDSEFATRFSNFTKLQRTVAWIQRFKFNASAKKNDVQRRQGPLTANELQQALFTLVRQVQRDHFSREFEAMKRGAPLPAQSTLKALSVFCDDHDLIRVGGRLRRSNLTFDAKYPMVLPKKAKLTTLIFDYFHTSHLHAGPQLTEAAVRQRYWVLGAGDAVRHFIHQCVVCHRKKTQAVHAKMADLPTARVVPSSPFTETGVDYTGHFSIKSKVGRGSIITKGYVCLFICLATRAIHLELVSDLTTVAFVAAFKRFISTRGKPLNMYSDNGTNFQGADREFKEFLRSDYYKRRFPDDLSKDDIAWPFNPPGAPHMGGLWEAGVKSIKGHLKTILGDAALTYEEFATCLKQVEAIVNSRPISPLPSSPDDLQPLTPGHFLTGRPLTAAPERDFTDVKVNRLNRWELVQQLVQHFWNRWSLEYLSRLQQRPKWWNNGTSIKPGHMVLLKEKSAPARWKLARIVATHPGDDGVTRVVTVRTATAEFQRPVTAISPLPINDANDDL